MEHSTQQEISLVLMPKNTSNVSVDFLLSQCKTHQTHLLCTSCNGSLVYVPTQDGLLEHYRCLDCSASFCLKSSLKPIDNIQASTAYKEYFFYQSEQNILILRDFLQQVYFLYCQSPIDQELFQIQLTKEQITFLSIFMFNKASDVEELDEPTYQS